MGRILRNELQNVVFLLSREHLFKFEADRFGGGRNNHASKLADMINFFEYTIFVRIASSSVLSANVTCVTVTALPNSNFAILVLSFYITYHVSSSFSFFPIMHVTVFITFVNVLFCQ